MGTDLAVTDVTAFDRRWTHHGTAHAGAATRSTRPAGKSCRRRGPLGAGDARGEADDQGDELGLSLGAELGEDGAQMDAGGM